MYKYEVKDQSRYAMVNDQIEYIEEFVFTFEFTTKEEYLAFRDGWKAEYLDVSQQIVAAKRDLKNEQRKQAGNSSEPVYYTTWEEESLLSSLQRKARLLMACVEAVKQYSRKQAEKQHAA